MPTTITIPSREYLDERTNEFVYVEGKTLTLEHSLLSISKWESRWHKSYLTEGPGTPTEQLDYVRCMTITPNVNLLVYSGMTAENWEKINNYINDPMTATTFHNLNEKNSRFRKKITNEEIYSWMVALEIPFECEKWHINRLMTLIKICNIRNQPAKKMNQNEVRNQYKALNEARRAKMGSKG